jgi:hypothetical protein
MIIANTITAYSFLTILIQYRGCSKLFFSIEATENREGKIDELRRIARELDFLEEQTYEGGIFGLFIELLTVGYCYRNKIGLTGKVELIEWWKDRDGWFTLGSAALGAVVGAYYPENWGPYQFETWRTGKTP